MAIANDSTQPGILNTTTTPLSLDNIEDIFHDWIHDVTELPNEKIMPQGQWNINIQPAIPFITFSVKPYDTGYSTTSNFAQTHYSDNAPFDNPDQEYSVIATYLREVLSIYVIGDNADVLARKLITSFHVEQNRDFLRDIHIGITSTNYLQLEPYTENNRNYKQYVVIIRYNRLEKLNYNIRTITQAVTTINDTQPEQPHNSDELIIIPN